jgi:hypothetical protein
MSKLPRNWPDVAPFVVQRADVYHDRNGIWRYCEHTTCPRVAVTGEVLDHIAVCYDAKAQGAARWNEREGA